MTEHRRPARMRSAAAVAALSIGLGVGGYGIASAASGSSTGSTAAAATTAAPSTAPGQGYGAPQGTPPTGRPPAPGSAPKGWGGQRSDETPLTGDALAAVTTAAQAEVPGGTVVRVETDADGNAKYEAHMTKPDGSLVTVYVDASYDVVSVQTGP